MVLWHGVVCVGISRVVIIRQYIVECGEYGYDEYVCIGLHIVIIPVFDVEVVHAIVVHYVVLYCDVVCLWCMVVSCVVLNCVVW